jgi:hypothetical protein
VSRGFVVTPLWCHCGGAGFVNSSMSIPACAISITLKAIQDRGRGAVSVAGFGEKNSSNVLRGQEMCRGIKRTPSIERGALIPNSGQEISAPDALF